MKKRVLLIGLLATCMCFVCSCGNAKKIEDSKELLKEQTREVEEGSNDEEDGNQTISTEKVYIEDTEIDFAYSDPDSYSGKYMKISGLVFGEPEVDGEFTYFQMYGDAINSQKNTIVVCMTPNFEIKDGSYVCIDGQINGSYTYENMLGGTISVLQMTAESVSESSYIDVVSPTLKEVQVNMPMEQHGYNITVEKVEFAKNETRVYLKAINNGSDKFYIYSFNTKLIQNGQQFEEQYAYDADYPELQSELLVGTETSGIIVFPPIDMNLSFELYCEANSDNWEEDLEPYRVTITP